MLIIGGKHPSIALQECNRGAQILSRKPFASVVLI